VDRATVISRSGRQESFMGANSYALKANWLGAVTLFADGRPVGFWWRPISMFIGLASVEDIERVIAASDEHRARMMGVKL
jgi:hypothetical protein